MRGEKTQWYIGTPNGVVLCVDGRHGDYYKGRFYHAYEEEGSELTTIEDMVFALESFYDSINFPHATTNNRTFADAVEAPQRRQERKKVMTDEELLKKHGDLGTFIIRVQHRQNSSWQGRVTWMEEDKTVRFRSIFEMIKLIESALDTVGGEEEEQAELTWE